MVTKRPLSSTMASFGQTVRQVPHRSQRSGWIRISGLGDWLSGLWHHQQRSGQPLRKTVVRMPGPSCTAKRSTRNTTPVTAAGSAAGAGTSGSVTGQVRLAAAAGSGADAGRASKPPCSVRAMISSCSGFVRSQK